MEIHIVSGGGGFLGSALCQKLYDLGHKVIAFDNFSRKSHQNNLDKPYTIYNGDVRNIDDLDWACRLHGGANTFWHLAYLNGTESFYERPHDVLGVGVKGAINSLDVCLSLGIKNYNLVSTSEVYGEAKVIPTPETEPMVIPDPLNPRFSYSSGKMISEMLAIHYGQKQGLNTKIFRVHNAFSGNMGQEHIIPQIIKKILLPENPKYISNKLVVNIQGTGLESRSFCFVDDIIDEMILASTAFNDIIFNIGKEDERQINEVINIIAGILNIPIIIQPGKLQEGSTPRRCPSMKKMDALGFKPKYSLKQGLEETVAWYKDFYLNEGKNE